MSQVNPKRPIIKQTRGVWDLNETYSETQEGYYKYGGPQEGVGWGTNYHGNLGQNTSGHPTLRSSPVQIMSGGDGYGANSWDSMQMVGTSAFGVKRNGTLWTWGENNHGQLGQNDRTSRSSPVQIPGDNWWPIKDNIRWQSQPGTYVCMAMRSYYGATHSRQLGKKLFMWGQGGKLGQNNNTSYSSPVQIPGHWQMASGGQQGPFGAINKLGELWMWADNGHGALGQNDRTNYSSPKQVPGTWKQLSCGRTGAGCLKADGTIWRWGYNAYGTLGQNHINHRSSPVQLGSYTNWKKMCSGGGIIAAQINEDNELWVHGWGGAGQLMQNNNISYSSPVQVPGSWDDFYVGSSTNAYGIKTDGSLWAVGKNPYGAVDGGTNTPLLDTAYSSPIQIPGVWRHMGPEENSRLGVKYG